MNHKCEKNYQGSRGGGEGMEVVKKFARSEAKRNVRYKNYLGDGDCKVSKDSNNSSLK